jgi:LDH2 family malate/lactate/ureidoglycolate dehydrogenase
VALTRDGEKTTDPKAAIEGILLPFGGYKGYAISLAIEILSGVITGAGYSKYVYSLHAAPDRQQNVGHLMVGIPIAAFISKDEYFNRMEDLSDIVKNGPKEKTSTGIYFPGDIENIKRKDHLINGMDIDEEIIKTLAKG